MGWLLFYACRQKKDASRKVMGCRLPLSRLRRAPPPSGREVNDLTSLPIGALSEGIERPENSPVDCMDASLDALRALQ